MRPRVRSQELEIMREALLHINVHGIVNRVAVRGLGVDRSERRNSPRRPQRAGCGKCAVKDGRRQRRVQSLDEEVIRSVWPEELCGCGQHHAAARRYRNNSRNWLRDDVAARRWVQSRHCRRVSWQGAEAAHIVLNLQIRARCIYVEWMRQVMRADEQVTG